MSKTLDDVLRLAAQHPEGIKLTVKGTMPGQLVAIKIGDATDLETFPGGQRLWIGLQDRAGIMPSKLEGECDGPDKKKFKVTLLPITGKRRKAQIDLTVIA